MYGDARENLCLDVDDLNQRVTLQPCSGGKYSQGWDLTNLNLHYNKCVSDPQASMYRRDVVLTTCGATFPRWKRAGTTTRNRVGLIGAPFRRVGTTSDYPEDAQSFLDSRGDPGSPVNANPRPWSEQYQNPSSDYEEWFLMAPPAYTPPDKNPCSGIICRPPADAE
ncbi:hypothetical protein GCM10009745_51400 [Kribbella yunnanensis]|uniref:Ricin B lectin domain-containing protein n=1 Tax=Kribbella yunnanensis TaxID=190194 RepID=A0ABP4U544_9ACTN